jgi:hypothetical protein
MRVEGRQNPMPQTEEGIEEVRWISNTDLSSVLNNTYPALKALLKTYLDAH